MTVCTEKVTLVHLIHQDVLDVVKTRFFAHVADEAANPALDAGERAFARPSRTCAKRCFPGCRREGAGREDSGPKPFEEAASLNKKSSEKELMYVLPRASAPAHLTGGTRRPARLR
mmetsp:Transcript_2306/g.7118  ORF Transcript_2306/g.7118 Transcript_2306/m.7118 type:complete len:116 (-) Transcript_2306:955-1302(-)